MFKKILLAADGSMHSIRASEKAIELAKYNKMCFLEIIYVVDSNTTTSNVLIHSNSDQTDSTWKEKLALIDKKARNHKINYEIQVLRGDPGPTIVAYCNNHDFDIIIIGSRGLNTVQEMVLGSVSHKVAQGANCPVMIVK